MENNIQKVKIDPLYDSSIPLLSIYPKKIKALTWKDICTPIFTAALSTITKIWMQPKFFSTNKWVIKIWHLHLYWYIPPSRITALSWQSGLCNSMKLWTMPCKATQDRQIIAHTPTHPLHSELVLALISFYSSLTNSGSITRPPNLPPIQEVFPDWPLWPQNYLIFHTWPLSKHMNSFQEGLSPF